MPSRSGALEPEITPNFRRPFETALRDGSLPGLLAKIGGRLGLPVNDKPSWEYAPEDSPPARIMILTLKAALDNKDREAPVELRSALLLPNQRAPETRIVVDVLVRLPAPTQEGEPTQSRERFSLSDIADMLAISLTAAALVHCL